jgi:hypothetical protein
MSGVVVAVNVAHKSVVIVVPVATSPPAVTSVVVTIDVVDKGVVSVVPVVVSPVSVTGVVVTLDVDSVVLSLVVGPAAMSPVAVAWVIVTLDVDDVLVGGLVVVVPAAVSPPSMMRIVVSLNIDEVGVNLLTIIVVPEAMSVNVADSVDRGVHNGGRVVYDVGIVILKALSPVAVSPVSMTRVVATLNIVGIVSLGEVVGRDAILHLAAQEDLGESKTDGVTVLIEVLVVPLSLSIHDLVVDVLTVDNEVVLDVEDEVPRVGEGLGHLAELVEVGADGGLALLELVGDIMDHVTEILDSVED